MNPCVKCKHSLMCLGLGFDELLRQHKLQYFLRNESYESFVSGVYRAKLFATMPKDCPEAKRIVGLTTALKKECANVPGM